MALQGLTGFWPCRIQDTQSSRGLCLRAITAIPRGSMIIADRPILSVPVAAGGSITQSQLDLALASLRPAEIDCFRTLWSGEPGPSSSSDLSRFHLNNFEDHPSPVTLETRTKNPLEFLPASSGAQEQNHAISDLKTMRRVFPVISRCNHSCLPNAFYSFNHFTGFGELRALVDIAPSEEITLRYIEHYSLVVGRPGSERAVQVPFWHNPDGRRMALQQNFGFICHCQVCQLRPFNSGFQARRLLERLATAVLNEHAAVPPHDRCGAMQELQLGNDYKAASRMYCEIAEQLLNYPEGHPRPGMLPRRVDYWLVEAYDTARAHLDPQLEFDAWYRYLDKALMVETICKGPNHPHVRAYREKVYSVEMLKASARNLLGPAIVGNKAPVSSAYKRERQSSDKGPMRVDSSGWSESGLKQPSKMVLTLPTPGIMQQRIVKKVKMTASDDMEIPLALVRSTEIGGQAIQPISAAEDPGPLRWADPWTGNKGHQRPDPLNIVATKHLVRGHEVAISPMSHNTRMDMDNHTVDEEARVEVEPEL